MGRREGGLPFKAKRKHREPSGGSELPAFWCESLGLGGDEKCLGGVPVDDVPEGLHVVGAAVLVVEVIGVFPNVEGEDGRAFDAGNCFTHERAVLVGGGADFKFAVVQDQPRPAGTKPCCTRGLKLFLKRFEAAEGRVDGCSESPCRLACGVGTQEAPKKGVVDVAAPVVAHSVANALGDRGKVVNERFGGFVGQFWRGFQRFIQVVDVRFVVFAMMDFHGARINVRFEGVQSEREYGELVHMRFKQMRLPIAEWIWKRFLSDQGIRCRGATGMEAADSLQG